MYWRRWLLIVDERRGGGWANVSVDIGAGDGVADGDKRRFSFAIVGTKQSVGQDTRI
jgi:hypothetical protein